MTILLFGLGNVGDDYTTTRHNIGFIMLDMFAENMNTSFYKSDYAYKADVTFNTTKLVLLKPTTFMNNSGLAVGYWSNFYNVTPEKILVLVDDLHLPFLELRFRLHGSHGGHNGLKNIESRIGTQYCRLRCGIGHEFEYGKQKDYVIGQFSKKEYDTIINSKDKIIDKIKESIHAILTQNDNNINNDVL